MYKNKKSFFLALLCFVVMFVFCIPASASEEFKHLYDSNKHIPVYNAEASKAMLKSMTVTSEGYAKVTSPVYDKNGNPVDDESAALWIEAVETSDFTIESFITDVKIFDLIPLGAVVSDAACDHRDQYVYEYGPISIVYQSNCNYHQNCYVYKTEQPAMLRCPACGVFSYVTLYGETHRR